MSIQVQQPPQILDLPIGVEAGIRTGERTSSVDPDPLQDPAGATSAVEIGHRTFALVPQPEVDPFAVAPPTSRRADSTCTVTAHPLGYLNRSLGPFQGYQVGGGVPSGS